MERIDAQGSVLIALDEEQVRTVARNAVEDGVQAIAILFLHSYRNPAHEQRAKAIVEQEFPEFSLRPRMSSARNTANTSALRPPRRMLISARVFSAI